MLARRLRRRASIKTTLGQRLVFAGMLYVMCRWMLVELPQYFSTTTTGKGCASKMSSAVTTYRYLPIKRYKYPSRTHLYYFIAFLLLHLPCLVCIFFPHRIWMGIQTRFKSQYYTLRNSACVSYAK